MMARIRLLPVLMFCAAMLLTVKVVEVWQGVEMIARGVSIAPVRARTCASKDSGISSRTWS